MRLELGALRRSLHLLEAIDEPERRGVEERELLFDRHREVGHLLEGRLGGGQQLLVADLLLVAHRGYKPRGSNNRSATRRQLQLRSTARRAARPRSRRSGRASNSCNRSRSVAASLFGN